ncbi:IPTL-CTERM sorting domain-containing protein [Pseudolysobacter antarcticus]|uniref:IPTL-CTERM sorting domain-containing protein n=1 Tax=Pseudolysobacter antarcticus TaxID=2511995 RepID=A0A411HJ32_9GAMM|nr:IPTL-CTERM sorting domain-containing protein [Pseudolysobacter antarcticus]QBB70491.1 IPTL-CTERM sorting domain-containing protein [Pseudolysobacter antarcticus]
MSKKIELGSDENNVAVTPKSVRNKGLHIPVPAVLVSLGMLSSSAYAAPIQDVYSTPVNTSLSGVNIFASDAANNPQVFSCTNPSNGSAQVAPHGDLFYTPNTAFQGVDTFSCTGSDNLGNVSASVSVYVGIPIPSPASLPTVSPAALGGLAAMMAYIGMRRRRKF